MPLPELSSEVVKLTFSPRSTTDGVAAGSETVAELKGRDMMVGRYAELLGVTEPA